VFGEIPTFFHVVLSGPLLDDLKAKESALGVKNVIPTFNAQMIFPS
jgi:hypothetical protein